MKKRILSVLLCLCMALVLLPTTALAGEPQPEEPQPLENVTFGFAYDVQRSPAFPAKTTEVTMSGLNNHTGPLLSGTQSDNDAKWKETNEGSWTLTRVGTYSYVKSIKKNSSILDSIVGTVAGGYTNLGLTLDKETIVIHELKNDDVHVAYGVVLAYNATDGIAVFVGDLWNSDGAGYLLSKNAQPSDKDVYVTAGMIATDFVKECRISLEPAVSHTFPEATVGYGDQTANALTVTVTNEGDADTGKLTVSLSGKNPNAFVVEPNTIDNIAVGGNVDGNVDGNADGNNSFTVTPKTGLTAGTYTATVKVSGTDIVTQSFDVEFTVKAAAPVVRPRPNTPSGSTTVTVDSPKTADNSGLFLWTVLLFASGAGVLGTVYSSRKRRAE